MKVCCVRLALGLVFLIFAISVPAQNSASARNSNLLSIGLPVYATFESYKKGDENGLNQLLQSEALTIGAVEILKSNIHRTRPDGLDNKSFPSTHAAVSFSSAQYLQMKGGSSFGVPAYAMATYVAYARVDAKKHYWSDVVAGGAIGAVSTYGLTKASSGNRLSMSWVPGATNVQWQLPLK
jgi:membrane-associated phospholipid phosphatase